MKDYEIRDLQARMDAAPSFLLVSAYSSSVIGDPVVVTHALGSKPDAMFVDTTSDQNVYATPDDRKSWTSTQVVVRGSAASQPFNLLLVKF